MPGAVPGLEPRPVVNPLAPALEEAAAALREAVVAAEAAALGGEPALVRHPGQGRAYARRGEAELAEQRDEAAHPHRVRAAEQVVAVKREDQIAGAAGGSWHVTLNRRPFVK